MSLFRSACGVLVGSACALVSCHTPTPPVPPAPVQITFSDGTNGEVSWSSQAGTIVLRNALLELRWRTSDGALIGLTNLVTRTELLTGPAHSNFAGILDTGTSDIWNASTAATFSGRVAHFKRASLATLDADPSGGRGARLDFEYDALPGGRATLVEHASLREASPLSSWTTDVSVDAGSTATFLAVRAPMLTGIATLTAEHLAWPWHEGVTFDGAGDSLRRLPYPVPASMQWAALYDDYESLYYGVRDDAGSYKELRFGYDTTLDADDSRPRQLSVTFWPYVTPGQTYTTPVVEIGAVAQGGWYWGADHYRDWLVHSRLASTRAAANGNIDGWHKGYDVIYDKDAGVGSVIYDYCSVPTTLMPPSYATETGISSFLMYGWSKGGLDHLYPDYDWLSPDGSIPCQSRDDLANAVRTLHARAPANRVDFYLNARVADVASRWFSAQGNASAVAGQNGDPSYGVETYPGTSQATFHRMCPFADAWIAQLAERATDLRNLGADGIYWDQVAEAPGSFCYNRNHGHRTPASAFGEGYAKLLTTMRNVFESGGPADYLFATEGINDYYAQFLDVGAEMPLRPFGYVRTADAEARCPGSDDDGVSWPCGNVVHAPELARYVIPLKQIGIPTLGIETSPDAYAWAFLMADPFKDFEYPKQADPKMLGRFTRIYDAEPEIYHTGRYLDSKGLAIDAPASDVRATLILGANRDRIGIQLWNRTNAATSTMAHVDLAALGISAQAPLAGKDLDGGPDVPIAAHDTAFDVGPIAIPARGVRAIKLPLVAAK